MPCPECSKEDRMGEKGRDQMRDDHLRYNALDLAVKLMVGMEGRSPGTDRVIAAARKLEAYLRGDAEQPPAD